MEAANRRMLQMSSTPQLIVSVTDDEDLLIKGVNHQFVKLTEFNRSWLEGRPLRDLAHDPDRFSEATMIDRIKSRTGERYVIEARRPGDIPYELSLNVVPQGDRTDPPQVGVVYAQNRTAWKLWRSVRTDVQDDVWDRFSFRLFVSRTIRRSRRWDQPFGILDVALEPAEFMEEPSHIRRRGLASVGERLVNHSDADDRVFRRKSHVFSLVRPPRPYSEPSISALMDRLKLGLGSTVTVLGDEYQFESSLQRVEYPTDHETVSRILGHVPCDVA